MKRSTKYFLVASLFFVLSPSISVGQNTGRQEIILVRSAFQVQAGSYSWKEFDVPRPLSQGRVVGNVMAQGGAKNDIRILLLKESQFQAWQGGSGVQGLYDSGRRRSIVLNTPISEAGKYYLVFDNRHAWIYPRKVEAHIRVIYEGIDEEAERVAAQRWERIGKVLGRLAEKLQELEQQWGTNQVRPPVKLARSPGEELNAYAWWGSQTVGVTDGFLKFTESLPHMSDDIIAGVLGHELGHIYYRHGRADITAATAEATAIGAAGAYLIHPLVGLLAAALTFDSHVQYDRQEETESDLFGIRLAGAAGYDPTGLLVFLTEVKKRHPMTTGFLNTHPSPGNRERYLRDEALAYLSGEKRPAKPEPTRTMPELIYSPPPEYTEEAKQRGIQGVVSLDCLIGEDGRIKSAKVIQGLGYGLDERALETVQKLWRFQPATHNGVPVSMEARVEVEFKLR